MKPKENFMRNHSLIKTLIGLQGNPRACVYTEPLWGIPFFLFMPFASVYMMLLGVLDWQIGVIASLLVLSRAAWSVLGGAITDKLGRKKATFIFDILSWSIPCLIWAFSQNFWWFAAAALFNGVSEVTTNSWNCLLVEDAEKSKLVDIYAWVHISGLVAVFFAPLAGFLVEGIGLVLAVRLLYLFSFLSMTLKFFILNRYADETQVGKERLRETRQMSIMALLSGYGGVARKLFKSAHMRLALMTIAFFTIITLITNTFFGLYVTRNLLMPEYFLAYFPIIRSGIMLTFLFIIQPKLAKFGMKVPMLVGVFLYIFAYAALIALPSGNLWLLIVCIFIESCAHGLVWPRRDSIQALFIEPEERARLNSVLASMVLIVTIPFGYLSGWLSGLDGRFPFVLVVAILAVAFVVILTNRALRTENVRALEKKRAESTP